MNSHYQEMNLYKLIIKKFPCQLKLCKRVHSVSKIIVGVTRGKEFEGFCSSKWNLEKKIIDKIRLYFKFAS